MAEKAGAIGGIVIGNILYITIKNHVNTHEPFEKLKINTPSHGKGLALYTLSYSIVQLVGS